MVYLVIVDTNSHQFYTDKVNFSFPRELYFGNILGGHIFFSWPDGWTYLSTYQHRVSDHYPGIPLQQRPHLN